MGSASANLHNTFVISASSPRHPRITQNEHQSQRLQRVLICMRGFGLRANQTARTNTLFVVCWDSKQNRTELKPTQTNNTTKRKETERKTPEK